MQNKIPSWLSTVGLFLIAIVSPCCFPLFGFVLSAFGVATDTFELFGKWTMWIYQAMMSISIAGLFISYRRHHCIYPLLIAIPSGLSILYGYHFNNSDYWTYFLYAGMFGLLVATAVDYFYNKLHSSYKISTSNNIKAVQLNSTITCPNCGHQKTETMPTDACQFFYECEQCKTVLKPKNGDCCVYCSYGDTPCPPIQQNQNCC